MITVGTRSEDNMVKTLKDGHEVWQDRLVEEHFGRFAGAFELDEETSVGINDGDVVTFMVTARADGAAYKGIRDSMNKRKTVGFSFEEVLALDPDKAKAMYDGVGAKVFGVNDGLVETTSIPQPAVSLWDSEYDLDNDLLLASDLS